MKKLVLIGMIFISACADINANANSDIYLDTYILSMLSDIRRYHLILSFSDGKNVEQDEVIKEALAAKISDLSHYLAETQNTELVGRVCNDMEKRHGKFKKMSNGCNEQFCQNVYDVGRICVAKSVR